MGFTRGSRATRFRISSSARWNVRGATETWAWVSATVVEESIWGVPFLIKVGGAGPLWIKHKGVDALPAHGPPPHEGLHSPTCFESTPGLRTSPI